MYGIVDLPAFTIIYWLKHVDKYTVIYHTWILWVHTCNFMCCILGLLCILSAFLDLAMPVHPFLLPLPLLFYLRKIRRHNLGASFE